jgi:16S rRNA processing protein RimM
MSRWVLVGRVGRPHGIDGSFVVDAGSDDPERFAVRSRVYVGRQPATVVSSKVAGGRRVVALDRDVARGAALELPAEELPRLAEGEFYAYELVGLAVEDEQGRGLGQVTEVAPGVANDVLELDSGLAIPLVEDWVSSVDLERGRIVIVAGLADTMLRP